METWIREDRRRSGSTHLVLNMLLRDRPSFFFIEGADGGQFQSEAFSVFAHLQIVHDVFFSEH